MRMRNMEIFLTIKKLGVLSDLSEINTLHPNLKSQLKALTIKDQDFVNIEYMGLYQHLGYLVIKGFD